MREQGRQSKHAIEQKQAQIHSHLPIRSTEKTGCCCEAHSVRRCWRRMSVIEQALVGLAQRARRTQQASQSSRKESQSESTATLRRPLASCRCPMTRSAASPDEKTTGAVRNGQKTLACLPCCSSRSRRRQSEHMLREKTVTRPLREEGVHSSAESSRSRLRATMTRGRRCCCFLLAPRLALLALHHRRHLHPGTRLHCCSHCWIHPQT